MTSKLKSKSKVIFSYNEKKKQDNEIPMHSYFNAHQCCLSAEKINSYPIKCKPLKRFILKLINVRKEDIRAQNLFRSYAGLCAEKYRQYKHYPFSVHPFSRLRISTEAFFVVFMLVSNTILAVHLSKTDPDNETNMTVFMKIFDVLYLTNVLENFLTGYVAGNTCKYVVLDLRKIAIRYARTWLVIDMLSAVSFVPELIAIKDLRPRLLLTSMKILRLPILLLYLDNVLTVMRVSISKTTICKMFVMILSYLTWNIYFQFAIEYMIENSFTPTDPRQCSWMSIGKMWNGTLPERFTYALDRAVMMLRKNSNINALTYNGCSEVFFFVAWVIGKLLAYHNIFTYIVSLSGSKSAKAEFYIMMKQVETFMNQRKFPPRIKKKILKFYTIRFHSHYFAESKMLACVTGQLREDIVMHTGRQLVKELEFLKHLPRSLLIQICMKLKIVIFIAGDIIFKINTIGECLYFIDKGTVAIYSESGSEICHLEDGDYFGEIALVMKHRFRTASAVAVTNCELFRLDKEDFDSSIACYPTVYETIKKGAATRFEQTCVKDEQHKTELRMEDDHNKKMLSKMTIDEREDE